MELRIGLDVISSYKRLSYTPWHAIAELVDNSTQSYFDNKDALDSVRGRGAPGISVDIVYDAKNKVFRISDTAMGMSYEDLEHALHIASPPKNTLGRSRYGMGLKTSAFWMGNEWSVRTTKLGESLEHRVSLHAEKIISGHGGLEHASSNCDRERHYTVVEIRNLNRVWTGRTVGKIKEFLRSMYRFDIQSRDLVLRWQSESLNWTDPKLLRARDGSLYRREFQFDVDGKEVHGWVGVLESGSRADAGFAIIQANRVIRGWPESWRPESLYGQLQGTNDLVNQRLVGEVWLDGFEVSHTKDDILWQGTEEDAVQDGLKEHCREYRDVAQQYRRDRDWERGPTERETRVAITELEREIMSPEMVDAVTVTVAPPPEVIRSVREDVVSQAIVEEPAFRAKLKDLDVQGYFDSNASPNDPYLVLDTALMNKVVIVINQTHPHWKGLKGSDGVLNYLRHCTYDGVAEWLARTKTGRVDADTVTLFKDSLLRVPFNIEMGASSGS